MGGNTSKIAKDDLENKLGESIVNNKNKLNYEYVDNKEKIETK